MPTQWKKSEQEFERACKSIPGGVNSPARAFGGVGGHPILMASGEGPMLTDIEGNQYIDYIGSWGPLILGHRHPAVVADIEKALHEGTTFGAPTLRETEVAELVVSAVPSVEKVRMTNSGTEASLSAVRVARGFTSRNKIIKFAGCYHGHVDSLLVQAGSAATTLGIPSSPGVPESTTSDTIVVRYNDLDDVKRAFKEHPRAIAAVLLEPVVGNMGLVRPKPGFLEGLREITQADGALLVFDEVMTGFRLSFGGAQQLFGVTPDLSILGKVIGGGLPVGAFGGRAEIMDCVAPVGAVYQAGTLSGNPLAMASGLATLRQLEQSPPYTTLEELSSALAEGLDQAATDAGIVHTVARCGSMLTLFFNPDAVHDYDVACRSNTELYGKFFWKMLERGVYLPCSQFEALFVSAAHTKEHIDQTVEATKEVLAQLA
ncbi:Glutamate-1-semialdehyde 2,1-aminomutase [Planctomycetes bacterium Pan216]|uniref:Glutamate-1-semialdehyde 2,1-aminomutase n=1 Tax=Kolteria novifilia TaxID=2527975 RepID=A0A518B4F6_9BACT|nr:Glutamate-1-semialdehyde 2,1-aminomutase [Planctomycetes bacterium Pan216]